ncbi:hypothetical protein WUBG_00971, partial [Wuchereria bancrofti]
NYREGSIRGRDHQGLSATGISYPSRRYTFAKRVNARSKFVQRDNNTFAESISMGKKRWNLLNAESD